jgi:hypothetical protein
MEPEEQGSTSGKDHTESGAVNGKSGLDDSVAENGGMGLKDRSYSKRTSCVVLFFIRTVF